MSKTDDAIGQCLDTKGYGVMSSELVKLFAAAGCSPPKCHAANCAIKKGQRFRIKAVARATYSGRDPITMALMVCAKCDEAETPIPDSAYRQMLTRSPLVGDEDIRKLVKIAAPPPPPVLVYRRSFGGCALIQVGTTQKFTGLELLPEEEGR